MKSAEDLIRNGLPVIICDLSINAKRTHCTVNLGIKMTLQKVVAHNGCDLIDLLRSQGGS